MSTLFTRLRRYVHGFMQSKNESALPSQDADQLSVHLLRMMLKKRIEKLYIDPAACAKVIGLIYLSDTSAGISRKQKGKAFSYLLPSGKTVTDTDELKRIWSLVIPPAWTDVWISPDASSHLQATGRDIKGRKQYRYHPLWNKMRNLTKYHRMLPFARLLPRIRQRITEDMKLPGMPREKVLAAVVQLLEKTLIRVGNEEYALKNKSFGLTTMHNKHVVVKGSKIQFNFKGKSGVQHTIDLTDTRLAKIVQQCKEIPGKHLFEYRDENGKTQCVDSSDVNAYLRDILGDEYTAKDYRTWRGTVLMASALKEIGGFSTQKEEKQNVTEAIKRVSQKLGNTPTVCRNYYIHPGIVAAYHDGNLNEALSNVAQKTHNALEQLLPEELAVLSLLTKHQELAEVKKQL